MGFKEEYNTNRLLNVAEVEVYKAIDELMESNSDLCTCPTCMLDLAALALNRMPPAYRVTTYTPNPPGALEVLWDESATNLEERAAKAVAHAAETIRNRPHH